MKKIFTTLCTLLLFTLTIALSAQSQIYVDASATGNETGVDWENAYTDLQAALLGPTSGDTIHVAQGIYKPAVPNGNPAATFYVAADLTLLGGYPNGGNGPRDPEMNPTILSGDLNGDDVPGDLNTARGDNVMTVVRILNGVAATIDGFTIQNGQADGVQQNYETKGGGIHCAGESEVILSNCHFKDNYAEEDGGAVHSQYNQIQLENCHFLQNQAGRGGGLMLATASGTIAHCTFLENTADSGGGLQSSSSNNAPLDPGDISITVMDSDFENNAASNWGGGAALFNWKDNTQIAILRCTFHHNETNRWGGGLRVGSLADVGDPVAMNTTITIDSCSFHQNTAVEDGAGLYAQVLHMETGLSLTNSTFTENTSAGFGGGATVYGGGPGQGDISLEDCLFQDNTASAAGGGLSIGSPKSPLAPGQKKYFLTGCRFERDTAGVLGGGMELYSDSSDVARADTFYLSRCVWEGNIANSIGGGMGTSVANSGMVAYVTNCEWQNNSSSFGGAIGSAPIFTKLGSSTTGAQLRIENGLMVGNQSDTATVALREMGVVELFNCTLTGNDSGGLAMDAKSVATLQNTILYNPNYTEFEALTGDVTLTSNGGNLVKDGSIGSGNPADFENQVPIFLEIGEPCEYYQLSEQSPGVDGGVVWYGLPNDDACGNMRIQGSLDVGAIETIIVDATEERDFQELDFMPNPATDLLTIEWPESRSQPSGVLFFSLGGQLLQQAPWIDGQPFDVHALPSGVYVVKVVADDAIFTGKLIKQ